MSASIQVALLHPDAVLAARLETVFGPGVDAMGNFSEISLVDPRIVSAPDAFLFQLNPSIDEVAETLGDHQSNGDAFPYLAFMTRDETRNIPALVKAGVAGFLLPDATSAELADAIRCVRRGGSYLSHGLLDALCESVAGKRYAFDLCLLSTREREVAGYVGLGLRSKEIARIMDLSVRTVHSHRLSIRKKTGARSRGDMKILAERIAEQTVYPTMPDVFLPILPLFMKIEGRAQGL